MGGAVLTAIRQSDHWRVKIAWPAVWPAKRIARYFGQFKSQAEAERWIKQHHWMTEQPAEPETPVEPTR
jgi:hypothetical protein